MSPLRVAHPGVVTLGADSRPDEMTELGMVIEVGGKRMIFTPVAEDMFTPRRSRMLRRRLTRWGGASSCQAMLQVRRRENDAPLCRHHHRCKQAEGWSLDQPEPGVLVWRTPSGRTYVTTPTEIPM